MPWPATATTAAAAAAGGAGLLAASEPMPRRAGGIRRVLLVLVVWLLVGWFWIETILFWAGRRFRHIVRVEKINLLWVCFMNFFAWGLFS